MSSGHSPASHSASSVDVLTRPKTNKQNPESYSYLSSLTFLSTCCTFFSTNTHYCKAATPPPGLAPMADRGRGRGRDPHDREGAGRGRGRGTSNDRPYRDYNQPDWDRDERFDSRDDYRKRTGGGGDDDWRDRRERREPHQLPLQPPQSGFSRRDGDFIAPSRHDRPVPPKPPSREGSRDSTSRGSLPAKVRDQSSVVPSPRERGMIDKPAAMSRPVGPPIQSAVSSIQTFTREVQGQSPVRKASSISNHNEPSPVGRSITHPSPKHQRDNSNTAQMGEAVQGTLAAAAIASWLQAMQQQHQHQQQGDGNQQFILAEYVMPYPFVFLPFSLLLAKSVLLVFPYSEQTYWSRSRIQRAITEG